MGATIAIEHGYMHATAKRLRGARIVMDLVTVTGTENLMMAAALAEGETLIENAAREPEVVDLARCLTAMGAKIEGAGSAVIRITGVGSLDGAEHRVMPDRIETGTYLAAATASGNVRLMSRARFARCHARQAARGRGENCDERRFDRDPDVGAAKRGQRAHRPLPRIRHRHAGAIHGARNRGARHGGDTETISRTASCALEMQRLGADIRLEGNTAIVNGVERLQGARVMATDLRASAGLVIAGLVATGETLVDRIYHLDRGYEALETKLSALGARVERVR